MKTFLETRRDIIAIMDLALISHFYVVKDTYGCTVTKNGDFYNVTITDRPKFQTARDTWAKVISNIESNATPTI